MDELVDCLVHEMELRKNYLPSEKKKPFLETIYFGGGTPSLLSKTHLEKIFAAINELFDVSKEAEITLEANPDDLTHIKLEQLRNSQVNRLSIGVQSFYDDNLGVINRLHNSAQAMESVEEAFRAGFSNISIDLIYGLPGLTLQQWEQNLDRAFSLPINHLSCYCLTIEPGTLLYKQVKEGKVKIPGDEETIQQFDMLMDTAARNNFEHYEISNFARDGFYSQHNSAYWKNKPYLGIGPSAHSYNGHSRQWNISSNAGYISAIHKNEIPATIETLSVKNKFNEYLMTALRTSRGVSIEEIRINFGKESAQSLSNEFSHFISSGEVLESNGVYILTRKGKHLADRIASSLFLT